VVQATSGIVAWLVALETYRFSSWLIGCGFVPRLVLVLVIPRLVLVLVIPHTVVLVVLVLVVPFRANLWVLWTCSRVRLVHNTSLLI